MKKVFVLCSFFFLQNMFAGQIKLINDTPYELKAVVSGNDDSLLGEVVLSPNSFAYWSETPGEQGYMGAPQDINKNYAYSHTPYRVLWLCMAGSEYALCEVVPTGAVVNAKSCPGAQLCHPPLEE